MPEARNSPGPQEGAGGRMLCNRGAILRAEAPDARPGSERARAEKGRPLQPLLPKICHLLDLQRALTRARMRCASLFKPKHKGLMFDACDEIAGSLGGRANAARGPQGRRAR